VAAATIGMKIFCLRRVRNGKEGEVSPIIHENTLPHDFGWCSKSGHWNLEDLVRSQLFDCLGLGEIDLGSQSRSHSSSQSWSHPSSYDCVCCTSLFIITFSFVLLGIFGCGIESLDNSVVIILEEPQR
jgi:hypothetical protein